MTSLPLYVPHARHARCGSFAALHCGQIDREGVVKKSCALLIFLRDLDVFFLGTAMVFLLFPVIHVLVSPFYFVVTLKSFRALNASITGSLLHEQPETFKSMPHS